MQRLQKNEHEIISISSKPTERDFCFVINLKIQVGIASFAFSG